jgi:hypothetical protein
MLDMTIAWPLKAMELFGLGEEIIMDNYEYEVIEMLIIKKFQHK